MLGAPQLRHPCREFADAHLAQRVWEQGGQLEGGGQLEEEGQLAEGDKLRGIELPQSGGHRLHQDRRTCSARRFCVVLLPRADDAQLLDPMNKGCNCIFFESFA
mmetsp:Transcript_47865/g.126718  ORF Transcript_47865/g.126718 Transcript_47865/m.126718 type:complete len:104 (-) Transcript_47865:28-339(-)